MKALLDIAWRDLGRGVAGGGWWLPVIFFLLIAVLFPFAIGPDPVLLARIGGGVVWTAALLAALLPVERLVAPDMADGVLDQYAVRGISEELVACAKILAHWLGFGPPLMVAALLAAGLMGLDGATVLRIEAGLALGTPGLAALAVTVAALTAGLRRASALAGLLLLPLAMPLLIFGAGATGEFARGGLYLLGAASLLLVAMAPFATAAAIRAARE